MKTAPLRQKIRALLLMACCMCIIGRVDAGAPVITNLFLSPTLKITSDLNVINQIQYSADLAHTNWVVLTNLLVLQSPYVFADISATNNARFYRVQEFPNVISPVTSTISLPGTDVSESSITAVLQARDLAGVILTNGGDTVVFLVQNGSGSATAGYTTDNGNGTYSAPITGYLAGSITVTATVNGMACSNTAGSTVVGGAATQLAIVSQDTTLGVGEPFGVTALARDAVGNRATSFSGTVTLSVKTGSGGLGGITSVPASSGQANFGPMDFNSAGTDVLQVTAPGLTPGVGPQITVLPPKGQ